LESLSEELVFFISQLSLDCFKGKFAGKPHDLHGKNHGFRWRFSQQNQSIETRMKRDDPMSAESAIKKRTFSGVKCSLLMNFCAKAIQTSCSYSYIMCIYYYIYIYVLILYIYTYTVAQICTYIYLISYISHKTIESSKWVRCGKTSRGFVYNFDPQLGWSLTHSEVPVVQMGSPARAPLGDRNLFLLEAQHINISYTTLIVVHKYDISLYNINSSSCIW
jgi:hypothetical protein